MRAKSISGVVVFGVIACGSSVFGQALMDMQAVRVEGSGSISADGKTVTLTELPADIQIDVMLSDWGDQGDTFGYNCVWDCAAYGNGSGVELWPNGAFCNDFETDVCQGVDESRDDFILRDCVPTLPICNTTSTCPDGTQRKFSCGTAIFCPGGADPGYPMYGATLSIHLPVGASGTYTPGLDEGESMWQYWTGDVWFTASGIVIVIVPAARPNPEEWDSPLRTACGAFGDPVCAGESYCIPAADGSFPGVCYVPKNRYVSVAPNPANTGRLTARRISLDRVGTPLVLGWMGPPDATGLVRIVDEASRHYMDWSTVSFPLWCSYDAHCPSGVCDTVAQQCFTANTNVVQVGDCHTSPDHTYLIEAILEGTPITDPAAYSTSLSLRTVDVWGDMIGATVGGGLFNLPPDGSAEFGDILGLVKAFQRGGASPPEWFDLVGVAVEDPLPDHDVTMSDVLAVIKGFQQLPYYLDDPCTCIGQPPCP